jgi:hypothetical protein
MSAVPNISIAHPDADLLQALAARAMAFTAADGLAIALADGDGMVCAASTGEAPAVGAKVGPGSKLSEKCIREATPVTYSRAADESGGAYSTILAPILLDTRAVGLCVAFANRANAFTDAHLTALTETAAAVCRHDEEPVPVDGTVDAEFTDTPAPLALNPEILKEVEDQIADFALRERRRVRMAAAVKFGVAILLLCGFGTALAPERVAAWVAPIVERLHSPNQEVRHSARGDRASR